MKIFIVFWSVDILLLWVVKYFCNSLKYFVKNFENSGTMEQWLELPKEDYKMLLLVLLFGLHFLIFFPTTQESCQWIYTQWQEEDRIWALFILKANLTKRSQSFLSWALTGKFLLHQLNTNKGRGSSSGIPFLLLCPDSRSLRHHGGEKKKKKLFSWSRNAGSIPLWSTKQMLVICLYAGVNSLKFPRSLPQSMEMRCSHAPVLC